MPPIVAWGKSGLPKSFIFMLVLPLYHSQRGFEVAMKVNTTFKLLYELSFISSYSRLCTGLIILHIY